MRVYMSGPRKRLKEYSGITVNWVYFWMLMSSNIILGPLGPKEF